jgi:hypothetical protein
VSSGAVFRRSTDAHRGEEKTTNNREQREQGERRHREKKGEETTRSNHQSEKEEKKEAQQRSTTTTRINAAATLTEIRGMYMGGAHHDVCSLSRKRYTQYVGQQPKGHWGNSENTHRRGPTRTKARKGVRMHERSGRKTDTTGGAKKKNTREVRGNSRAD